MLNKANKNTQKAFDEMDRLIEQTKTEPPVVFPYSTRELSSMFGISNSLIYLFLLDRGFIPKRRRWYYRHNEGRHE